MCKHLFVAGIAAAALIPTFALAQQSCEQQSGARVAGTVVGAGVGALLGNAIAGRGDRTAGTIIGGVGGAVIGNQVTKPDADCAHAYGYYDSNNIWHATGVDRAQAQGYFDRNGTWIQGAPNGYYDGQNRYVPVAATSYYDQNGQLVGGYAPGHYDANGRWVAGAAIGRYDANGRWMPGEANGRRDANGVWVADAQTGYYDENGRWRAGQVTGYYDPQGRWMGTQLAAETRRADAADARAAAANDRADRADNRANARDDRRYDDTVWRGAPDGVRQRVAWLDQRVRRGQTNGTLSRDEANRVLRSLNALRLEERGQRHYQGQLDDRVEVRLQAKLDLVNDNIQWRRQNNGRAY
ncbi:MAG TPA: glycine zipper 2TM domain-containing protein [Caulobacteraceae bacterium]|jgi:hypothetical protein|nr:glycine zipper 2TM domain-containing protein [Caulobacteraceae bacterium]